MHNLSIDTPATSQHSTIHIAVGLLSRLADVLPTAKYSQVFIVCDEHVAGIAETIARQLPPGTTTLQLPATDQQKTIATVTQIWEALAATGCDRHSLLIAIGGGVIGDLGGFAASTYMRGIDFITIPTTLLAQVDASVGGKTGCNVGGIKNLVGTITQPAMVLIDPSVLRTLPERERNAGFAEIIKHGLIASKTHFEQATAQTPNAFSDEALSELIADSCQIKITIVSQDIREAGTRKLVNFGHTVGHALEALSLDTSRPLLHGEAVALGMVAEAAMSQASGLLAAADFTHLQAAIKNAHLPITAPPLTFESVLAKMRTDKKNTGGSINITMLTAIGQAKIDQHPAAAIIAAGLSAIGITP